MGILRRAIKPALILALCYLGVSMTYNGMHRRLHQESIDLAHRPETSIKMREQYLDYAERERQKFSGLVNHLKIIPRYEPPPREIARQDQD